jgi:hypothetical protein
MLRNISALALVAICSMQKDWLPAILNAAIPRQGTADQGSFRDIGSPGG